jgi:Holliday junction resolvase RusA-like endonuclease
MTLELKQAQEGTKTGLGDVFGDADDSRWLEVVVEGRREARFHVPGAVVGKGRPRIGKAGGFSRMFTPEKTANYETLVKWYASQAMKDHGPMSDVTQNHVLLDGPVQVNMLVGVAVPESWSKKKQAQALAGTIYPTSKPDLDNSIKSVFDAMNGVVYRDDAQVVTTVTKKRYREAPGLWVTVFQLGADA